MRLRIHHLLFAGFLGVVGLLVALIVVLVGSGLRRELVSAFQAELGRELALSERIVASSELAPDSLARLITARIGYRVTVIDTSGVVLGDSYIDSSRLGQVDNHASRPEVRGLLARGDTVSFAQRASSTVGLPLLYAARRAVLGGRPVVLRIAAELTDVERTVDRVQRTVAGAGVFAMMLALAAAYWFSRAVTRPLVTLADRARRLTEGDFSHRVPHGRVAELEDVAVAFNRLTEELRARLSELGRERDEMQTLIDCMAEGVIALTEDARVLRTNRTARALLSLPEVTPFAPIGSVVRNPELREALEASVVEPAQSREIVTGGRHLLLASRTLDLGGAVTTFLDITELRRLEQVRRDFVANASHELKTPLTAVRGFAETLLEGDPPADLKQSFLSSIRNNTLRMQRLVDDLLDLSRLESGGWSARPEECVVGEVAHEAWELVGEAAGPKGMRFDVDADVAVLADRPGLVQVFRNLFENAVRHTDAGGVVQVRVRLRPKGRVEVAVSDDGEGIPRRALPRVFERFYRADSSRARDIGGTGLGLAIVRHLIVAMGGEVWAESELGRGTTMRFTLPAV